MKVHRIYLGLKTAGGLRELTDQERALAVKTVAGSFEGFTMFEASGYWQGKREPAYVFEILDESTRTVFELAAQLRERLDQSAVMVTVERDVDAHLVSAGRPGALPTDADSRYSVALLASVGAA